MEASAITKTIVPPALVTAILLIFGGCCSNVYTLESITHGNPNTGSLITFAQFLAVAIGGYIQFSFTHSGQQAIWQHRVPLIEYCKIVGFHFSVSILNNMALDYHISVPAHIILRSGGSVVTMLLAFTFYGRKYGARQIAAVLLVTVGIVISTVSGRSSSSPSSAEIATENDSRFLVGIGIMVLSQFLSSAMGLYLERTFRLFGPSWKETLFFTHLLALPFFVPFLPSIWGQFKTLAASPPFFPMGNLSVLGRLGFNPPALLVHLFLNMFTQLVCVSGVNQLASTSTALSVSIVLNLRKFTSLILSFILFGHPIDTGIIVGGLCVFTGALWYAKKPSVSTADKEPSNGDLSFRPLEPKGETRSNVEQGELGAPLLSPTTEKDEDVDS